MDERHKKLISAVSEILGEDTFVFALVRKRGMKTCDVVTNPNSHQEFNDVRAFLVRLQVPSEQPHDS
jgi:hypothetical protein